MLLYTRPAEPGSAAANAMSLTMQCGVCSKQIKEDAKKVFCFGPCGLVKHLKCSNEIDDAGLIAMENNRGLRYLCYGCRKHQSDFNSVINKCNEMLGKFNENLEMLLSIEENMQNMELNASAMKSEMEKQKIELERLINEKSKSVESKIESLTKQFPNNKKKGQLINAAGPNTRSSKKRRLENGEVITDGIAENVSREIVNENMEIEITESPPTRETFAEMVKKNKKSESYLGKERSQVIP